MRRDLIVDLFEMPQRAAFRERLLTLRASGRSERKAAAELGLTVTAAQRAAALHRRMEQLELIDPYVLMTEPFADKGRMVRHLHPRFHFEPLPGHTSPMTRIDPPTPESG